VVADITKKQAQLREILEQVELDILGPPPELKGGGGGLGGGGDGCTGMHVCGV